VWKPTYPEAMVEQKCPETGRACNVRQPAHNHLEHSSVLDVASQHNKEERRIWNIPGGYKKSIYEKLR